MRLDGFGKSQIAKDEGFWMFIGRKKGRRLVAMDSKPMHLDASMVLAAFSKRLEELLNS